MLYPTIGQPAIFFAMLATGFACGLIFDLARFLTCFFKSNKIVLHIFQFIATCLCFYLFYVVNLYLNYGLFRFYAVLAFLLGLLAQRFLFSKIIAKTLKKFYNLIRGKRKKEKDS